MEGTPCRRAERTARCSTSFWPFGLWSSDVSRRAGRGHTAGRPLEGATGRRYVVLFRVYAVLLLAKGEEVTRAAEKAVSARFFPITQATPTAGSRTSLAGVCLLVPWRDCV